MPDTAQRAEALLEKGTWPARPSGGWFGLLRAGPLENGVAYDVRFRTPSGGATYPSGRLRIAGCGHSGRRGAQSGGGPERSAPRRQDWFPA